MHIIEVNHVTKEYQLGQLQNLKITVLHQWRWLTGQPVEERGPFKALNVVTFSAEQGEALGIIGHNDASKCKMLKLLAKTSKPKSCTIKLIESAIKWFNQNVRILAFAGMTNRAI